MNDRKTEIANFSKNNCNPEDVTVNGVMIRTKKTIRVTMDTMLSWLEHVNNTVNNVQSKINAILMI